MRYLGLLLLVSTALPLHAQAAGDGGAFLTRLGTDTIAVERFVRTGDTLTAVVALRIPRTTLTAYRMVLDPAGRARLLQSTTHAAAQGTASPALSRQVIRFDADSIRFETTQGGATTRAAIPAAEDPLPFIDMVHWPYELVLQRARARGADSLAVNLLAGRRALPFSVIRTGPDGYAITHPSRGTMTTVVDARGRLLQLDAAQTTRALLVTRMPAADVDALARAFAAVEAAGRPLGELSGRGEARGEVDGATLTVDYGRPAKRGREIFGALVPFDAVWRTGANMATHLTTDRDLLLGSFRLPAGRYTLFSIPGPDAWTLIINRRVNITGTAHDPAHDVVRLPIPVRSLPETVELFTILVEEGDTEGGALRFQWDRSEAVLAFRVVPAGG